MLIWRSGQTIAGATHRGIRAPARLLYGRFMAAADTVLVVGAALMGAIVGSFLNVVIYRLPRGDFFRKGHRSVCPKCGMRIAWHDNVPVLGWLRLGGRARCCGARISPRYPVVETLTAALFVLLWLDPPSHLLFHAARPEAAALAAFTFHGFFIANLVASSFIDLEHRILPDELTKSGMVVGCIGAVVVPGLVGERFEIRGLNEGMDSLLFAAAGLVVGSGVTWVVRLVASPLFRQEAMGFGDVKFMAAIGAFVGWKNVLLTFFLGCVLGAAFGVVYRLASGQPGRGLGYRWSTGDREIYFGPFLAIGAVISLFAGSSLVDLLGVFQQWQRTSAAALWILLPSALASVFLLIFLVRRGRAH